MEKEQRLAILDDYDFVLDTFCAARNEIETGTDDGVDIMKQTLDTLLAEGWTKQDIAVLAERVRADYHAIESQVNDLAPGLSDELEQLGKN